MRQSYISNSYAALSRMRSDYLLQVGMKKITLLFSPLFFISKNTRGVYLKLLLITQINTLSLAQTPYFKNFTENDGLASSTVYFICQDSNGFIWFATDAGVSRYNGYAFENYTTKNGLGDNEIFKIFEDSQRRIWFLSYNGKISYWKNGKFYNSNNKSFLKLIDSNSLFTHLIEDKKGNLWIGTERSGLIQLNPNNIVKRNYPNSGFFYFYEATDEKIIATIFDYVFLGIFDFFNTRIFEGTNTHDPIGPIPLCYKYIGNDNLLFSKNDKLSIFNHKKLSFEEFPCKDNFQKILNICEEKGGIKWICTRDGAYKLSESKTRDYLKGEPVSYVLKDHEGNTWFSTLGKGVYFTPSLEILSYTKKEGLPIDECYSLKADSHEDILIGQEKGWLTKISKGKISYNTFLNDIIVPNRGRITSICETYEGIWVASDFGIGKIENNKTFVLPNSLGQKCIIKIDNKLMFGGTYGTYVKQEDEVNNFIKESNFAALPKSVKDQKKFKFWGNAIRQDRIHKLFKDSENKIWIGMNNGLRMLRNDSLIDLRQKYPQLDCRITGIKESTDHSIWISSYGKGVFCLQNRRLQQITERDGLLSDICNNIEVDKDNIIWVATNKGINKIWLLDGKIKVDYLNFNNGLISNQINDICVKGNEVWIATPKGLGYLEKNLVNKSTPPYIHITSFYVLGENKSYNKKKDYSLRYNENSIKIDYVGISYRHFNSPLLYRYKFDKKDTTWHYTTNTSIEFPQLNPGTYQFKVECKNNDGLWSTKSSSISFTIQTPFWQTYWFYFILICLAISGIWFVFTLRFKNLEKKEILLRTVTESKLKALRAQMDPHFIFNSLLALQNLVKKNADDAETYISKFAKLMRLTLDNSRSEYIPLADEIETLKNYLELQQLRRINVFEYNIYIDPNIDINNTEIPPMLAQPFIENSIEHGIFNKTEKGVINVRFTIVDNLIELEVEDNGIGLQKSMEMREKIKKIHKSLATTIIKERLELLNRKKGEKIGLNMADVKDEMGSIVGTRVTIRIPYLNQF